MLLAPLLLAAALPARAELSLEQKVGQLFMVAIDTEIAARREADIRAGRLGGGLLRWDRFTGPQARAFAQTLEAWTSGGAGAPFLLAVDHEGGPLFTQRSLGATIFPGNMALGAAGSPDLAEQAAAASGRELRALGIGLTFAPVLDVNSNPDNPIIGLRSFGEDPDAVARLGAAAVRGYLAAGVAPTLKHYPGHGDTSEDSHLGLPVSARTRAELEAVELKPFVAAKGAPAVMPAHMVFPALGGEFPVTLSAAALSDLRRRLGFDGVIVSDSLDMGAIANVRGSSEAARAAFAAGCDLLLLGKADFPAAYAALLDDARSGRIAPERLDASVRRIAELKRRFGRAAGAAAPDLSPPEHLALARRVAEESVTLLRADPTVLPLGRRPERLLVVLSRPAGRADDARRLFDGIAARAPGARLVELGVSPSTSAASSALSAAADADVVLFGEYFWGPYGVEQVELARRLEALGKPVVHLALMNPYGLRALPEARCALCLFGLTPHAADAAARLLFGEIPPRGRLPVTIPGFARCGDGLRAWR
ncbi:MAG: hypothetical protein HY552_06410 [Elusimicrobia bacterium]|nr:hypothetical protein [Elusimicrobiota bacterium]